MAINIEPICDRVLRLNMEFERQGLGQIVSIEVKAETGTMLRAHQGDQMLLMQDVERCHEAGYCATLCGVPFYKALRP